MRGIIMMVLFTLLFSPVHFAQAKASPVQNQPHLSTWFWHTEMIETHPSDVLSFIKQQQVKTVYLQVNSSISPQSYQTFIQNLSKWEVEVHALDGSPSFSEEQLANFYTWLTTYQEQAAPNQKFKGVHLDVEPYLHSDWQQDNPNAILRYQEFVIQAKDGATRLSLPLSLAIPFWFDEFTYSNLYGSGNLAKWIIEQTDAISIMAYRDSADAIIQIVKEEINWANQLGKKVIIGVETNQTDEPSFITFHEEGEAYMKDQLTKVALHYQQSPSYAGICIHDLKNWMVMKK
ncbi:amidase [Ammoniphilus sp. YIM 78166]|uniref:amidase n=1 Tax=Ammoniphilus sp. YIM 78166 TaxID=1644106 RepID=UPI00107053A6|nr:amidase [Ammoniphilus sp. YIM 78166]